MEREHKRSFISVHLEVVINCLPLNIGKEENIIYISLVVESCSAKENYFD